VKKNENLNVRDGRTGLTYMLPIENGTIHARTCARSKRSPMILA
jgi:hypothetical protein